MPALRSRLLETFVPCILASGSPRRRELLSSLGLAFTVQAPPPGVEPLPEPGESPEAHVARSALAKALSGLAFANTAPHPIIIAADTVVSLAGQIFGKPASHDQALAFLSRLSGQTHAVTTGVAIAHAGGILSFQATTHVTFWDCPAPLLETYAADKEVLDKAGAYAIQGKGAFLVQKICGSWSNVVGLPVTELVVCLLDNHLAFAGKKNCPPPGSLSR